MVGDHQIHPPGQHLLHHRSGQLVRYRRRRDRTPGIAYLQPYGIPCGRGMERGPAVDGLQYVADAEAHMFRAVTELGPGERALSRECGLVSGDAGNLPHPASHSDREPRVVIHATPRSIRSERAWLEAIRAGRGMARSVSLPTLL